MVRLYRALLERMFVALAYERYAAGFDLKQSAQWVRDRLSGSGAAAEYGSGELTTRVGKEVYYLRNVSQVFNTPGSMDDLLKDILDVLEQSAKSTSHNGDGDLIDSIVSALKLPYAGNVLSGTTMGYLKRALLLPEEIAQFQGRLTTREMSCTQCGHEFRTGEMATCMRVGDGGGYAFYCVTCYQPEYRICNKCSRTVQMDTRLYKAVAKGAPCEVCAGNVKAEDLPETQVDERVVVNENRDRYGRLRVPVENLRRAGRGAVAAHPPQPRNPFLERVEAGPQLTVAVPVDPGPAEPTRLGEWAGNPGPTPTIPFNPNPAQTAFAAAMEVAGDRLQAARAVLAPGAAYRRIVTNPAIRGMYQAAVNEAEPVPTLAQEPTLAEQAARERYFGGDIRAAVREMVEQDIAEPEDRE